MASVDIDYVESRTARAQRRVSVPAAVAADVGFGHATSLRRGVTCRICDIEARVASHSFISGRMRTQMHCGIYRKSLIRQLLQIARKTADGVGRAVANPRQKLHFLILLVVMARVLNDQHRCVEPAYDFRRDSRFS
jgi:hypothetical protein